MEQNLLLYQSSSGNFRTKGSNFSKSLQVAFLLVVCLWLLYQMKHDPHNYGSKLTHRKLKNENATTLMGPKQNLEFPNGSMTESDRIGSSDVKGNEDRGSEDGDFDRNSKEEAGESWEELPSLLNGDRVEEEEEDESGGTSDQQSENESGFYSFDDENGVPSDALDLDLVNSTSYDRVWTA